MKFNALDQRMLRLLSCGWTQKEIAAAMNYSPSAIHRRLRGHIYPALGAANATQAVYRAVKAGLIL